VQELYEHVPVEGFGARIKGRLVLEVARQIVALAEHGLRVRNQQNARGEDETIFLDVLKKRVSSGKTLSDELLEKFFSEWRQDITPVFGACAL
jgi:glutamate--cysteine ligase